MHPQARRVVLAAFLLLSCCFQLSADILFSEAEWDFGTITDEKSVSKTFIIENTGDMPVRISLVSSCDCLSVEPAEFSLKPHSRLSWTAEFSPAGYSGDFSNVIVVRTTSPGLPKAFFQVEGTVRNEGEEAGHIPEAVPEEGSASQKQADSILQGGSLEKRQVSLDYYYSSGCRSCTEFLEKTIPELEKKLDAVIRTSKKNIFDQDTFKELNRRLADRNIGLTAFPVLFAGTVVLQGEREIQLQIEQTVSDMLGTGVEAAVPLPHRVRRPSGNILPETITVLPVLTAGLLDGINPCAFTTIIFLLSALAVAGKRRREILIIGLCFAAAVFITYYLIGIGLFQVLRTASFFPLAARIIRWALVVILFVFAGLSIYDYFRIRQGDNSKIVLQLPKSLKRKIHDSVRQRARSAAIAGSAVVMGFLVSVFELACTGQIYFPVIAYMVRSKPGASGLGLLLIYNLGFIIPLLIVFLLTYLGVRSQRITDVFQKHMGAVKLGTAGLFLILAVFTLVL